MNRKIWIAIMGTLSVLCLAGCGDGLNKVQSQNINSAQSSLTRPVSDISYGFTKIEKYIAREDYASATTISRNLYDEFHDAILPPLTAKKGKAYADDIHKKYDELEAAIRSKNKSKITKLIKVNQDNLKTTARILGVSLISS
ncbi:hypothetical protein [Bacillus sp. EB600]|uniref:hypothetical protein n=1 Tax=Bacillus sp. EB600 TaxID=2806345 RepID=UPI00210BC915|nr:hypothetical protein [Bacillus sp. EB600]MCQ6281353.1 hypothetical protein [Bacillus sp. EB600]